MGGKGSGRKGGKAPYMDAETRRSLYRKGGLKQKEAAKAARRLKKQIEKTSAHIARNVKDMGEKELVPTPEAEDQKWKCIYARTPAEMHIWVCAEAAKNNGTISDVVCALIKCAQAGTPYVMPKLFDPLERAFYAAEIRKQRRIERIERERAILREQILRDRDATYHGLVPSEIATEKGIGRGHGDDGT